jgi:hypothetical protein
VHDRAIAQCRQWVEHDRRDQSDQARAADRGRYTLLYTWTGWVALVFMRAGIHHDLDLTLVVGITGALVSATAAFALAERASALRTGRYVVPSTLDEITEPEASDDIS